MGRPNGSRLSVILLLFGAALLTGWLLLHFARPSPRPEPIYAGKPVSHWALELSNPSAADRERAASVIRAMGPDAVAPLVHLLRTPDPLFATPVRQIGWRLPRPAQQFLFRIVDPFSAPARRAAAAQAFRILGTNAQHAVPKLQNALLDEKTVA